MRSRVSRKKLIRRVVWQLLTSGLHAPDQGLNFNADGIAALSGGMTSPR